MTMMELQESSAVPSGGSHSPSSDSTHKKRALPMPEDSPSKKVKTTTTDDASTPSSESQEVIQTVSNEEMEREFEQLQEQDGSDAEFSEYGDSADVSCSEAPSQNQDANEEDELDIACITDEAAQIISMLCQPSSSSSTLFSSSRYFEKEEEDDGDFFPSPTPNVPTTTTAEMANFLMADGPFSFSSEHDDDAQDGSDEVLPDNFLEEMLDNAQAEAELKRSMEAAGAYDGQGEAHDNGGSRSLFSQTDDEQDGFPTLPAPSPNVGNPLEFQEI